MRMLVAIVAIATGCGRIDFSPVSGGSDGSGGSGSTDARVTFPGDDGGGTNPIACSARQIQSLSIAAGGMTFSGNLVASSPNDTGSCGGTTSEDVYELVLTAPTSLVLQTNLTGTTAQTVLYIRTVCDDPSSEIVCASGKGGAASLYFESLAAGTYYVYVDGNVPGHYNGQLVPLLADGALCSFTDTCEPGATCICGTTGPKCRGGGCVLTNAFSGSGPFTTSATTSGTSFAAATCGGNDGGYAAPEAIYTVALPSAVADMHISTVGSGTTFDTIVYVRSACNMGDIACNDDASSSTTASDLHTGPLAAGTYYVFVDGYDGAAGTAQLSIDTTP